MLDSLRKDHVGCYGNDWIKTPAIDRLARDGVLFTRAFPEALPTLPVRRALYTGMRTFPNRNYVPRKGDNVKIPGWEPIPENQVTLSEILRREGYLTAMFSSTYHMFKPSMNFHRGFDSWEWIRGQESDRYKPPLNGEVENLKNLPCDLAYGCVGHSLKWCLANMQGWEGEADWFPPKTFGAATDWLEENRDVEKFLLVVDEFDPHEPWNAPKNLLDMHFNTADYEGRRIINTETGPFQFLDGELEYTRAQYAGEVTLVDKYVGKLVDKIKELGVWDDTMIVLTSDHGHPIMEHGILHKAPDCLYPELMDSVLIIYHPEKEYAGTACDAYVGHQDIPATVLALAGVSAPVSMDGQNAWDWVTGQESDRRRYATSIFGDWVWCRNEEYAYISDVNGNQARLYDLQEDPNQYRNIAEEKTDLCWQMYKRILADAGGSIPNYDVRRDRLRWYDAELI